MRKTILLMGVLLISGVVFAQQSSNDEVKKWAARAKTAYNMGEYQDALEEYKKVQKAMPQFPDVYKNIADVYEKLGTVNDLREAVVNYNKYLELSPKAQDRESILEKIASIEYITEKQVKQDEILDDLSGLWISNLVLEKDKSHHYVILKIEEVKKTGKYRVTILPESGMYKESIIEKTVNIVPTKDNSFRFILADAISHNPSSSKYDFLRIGASALGGSDLTQALAQTSVNAMQEKDLPSNTQTAYYFELKYSNGKLEGLLNVVQKYANTQTNKTTQDKIYEIYFVKNNDFFDYSYRFEFGTGWHYGGLYGINNMGHKKGIINDEIKQNYFNNPKCQDIKSAYKKVNTGSIVSGIGAGCVLGGGLWKLVTLMLNDENKKKEGNTIGTYLMIGGGATTLIGLPILISGSKRMKEAIEEYNDNSSEQKKGYSYNLNFGITTSGGVGLTLNF